MLWPVPEKIRGCSFETDHFGCGPSDASSSSRHGAVGGCACGNAWEE